jgi:hypothetical protein
MKGSAMPVRFLKLTALVTRPLCVILNRNEMKVWVPNGPSWGLYLFLICNKSLLNSSSIIDFLHHKNIGLKLKNQKEEKDDE